jgi:hypothetical protein
MFDALAHEGSLQFWLTTRRRGLAAVASELGAFLAVAIRNERRH